MPASSSSRSSPAFGGLLCHVTCLKPTYSLRRQLLISFGVTGMVTTSLVVLMACLCVLSTGRVLQQEARAFMGEEVIHSITTTSHYAADSFSQELDHLRGTVSLIVEIVRDRIVGYPLEFTNDRQVPFVNTDGQHRYPLQSPLLPRDWNITPNVNTSNYREHVQELFDLLQMQKQQLYSKRQYNFSRTLASFSTESAAYVFQGNCNPAITNPTHPAYYPNCTDANNDGTTGGVLRPTSVSAALEAKAADIGTLLKPIWESRPDLVVVTVHFVNEGAGSKVQFPGFVHDNNPRAYQSIGCEWLYNTTNPRTGRPFLSANNSTSHRPEDCHPAGTWVPQREYNAMETEFCRDQALHPDETRFYGPIVNQILTFEQQDQQDDALFWIMRVGRAIFDRRSGEFIGCVAVELLLNRWTQLIIDTLAVQNYSSALLVRGEEGVVVAGGHWSLYESQTISHIQEDMIDVIGMPYYYDDLRHEVDRLTQLEAVEHPNEPARPVTAIIECTSGRTVSASSLPGSDFLYIQAVGPEVFDVIDQLKYDIDQDVLYSTLIALLIGGIGMTVLMIIVWVESMILTRPLNWIQQIAWSIVNHTNSSVIRQSLRADDDQEEDDSSDDFIVTDDTSVGTMTASLLKWTPNTEITELVKEFKQMIRGFSGAGKASTVAQPKSHEIRNTLVWQSDFQQLYNKSKGADYCGPQTDVVASRPGTKLADSAALKHSLRSLEIPCGDEDCKDGESETTDASQNPASDSTSESDHYDVDHIAVEPLSTSPDGKGSYRYHQATPMSKDSLTGPGVSRIAEDSSAPSECLFRSSKRDHDVDPGITLAHQPALIPVQSATTATTTTFIPHLAAPTDGWKNEGRNYIPPTGQSKMHHDHESDNSCIPYQSPLYRWILVLFVVPMIITNAVIAVTVSRKSGDVLPGWIEDIGDASFQIQLEELSVTSKFASLYCQAVLATPVRDLFVYMRLAGWLFTDAVEIKPDAFVDMGSGSEECKAYPDDGHSCPWYADMFNNAPCDCSWEVPPAPGCFQFDETAKLDVRDTRWMQKLFYAGQRHDADPVTGRRTASSYPMVDYTPANTSWWNDDVESVPGAQVGNNASGSSYQTTYDRLRAFSALSVMIFPLYNYRAALVDPDNHRFLGAYFGFEADGMLAGWAGCRHPSPKYPHFQSKESNQAFKIAPELCPEGKFGYDARCRGWYDTGKQLAQEAGNASSLFLAPPYEFASLEEKASSATQAIVDPRTGEFIGQILVDFLQFELTNFCDNHDESRHESFYFVITPSEDALGSDTVFASGQSDEDDSTTAAIGDIMLPYDDANSTNRLRFDEVVSNMKDGSSCLQNFTRTAAIHQEDGYTVFGPETFWFAYDPVHVRALDTVRSDDYSRGLKVSEPLVYSLGVGRTEQELKKIFEEFKKEAEQPLTRNIGVYIGLIILISLLAASVSCRLSVSIARPMIILLHVVQQINSGKIEEDIAPLFGGSREVNQVYTSFAKLYKTVRVSNSAFFSRNLHWACHFVRDALNLFSKIEDRKAIAIASGNLGSTLLAINCSRPRETRISCLLVESVCCVKEACVHFETAVRSGTEDFQTAAEMSEKVEFAEQLSDRLFNRGLYYLLSMDDPCAEEDFEARGLDDLMKVQAMDLDVLEYWIKNGMLKEKSSTLFDRLLRRLHGLCALMENGVSQTLWDPKSLAYDCHRLISAAWDNPTDPLFEGFTQIGRLQQLEGALINLQLQKHLEADAARIAMRMLVEDEYLDERSVQYAADALLRFTLQPEIPWSPVAKLSAQRDIRNMLKSRKQSGVHSRKCVYLCMELSETRNMSSPALRHQLLSLYDSHCGMDDYFGLVACRNSSLLLGSGSNNQNNQNQHANFIQLDLECKKEQQGEQRQGIESALDALAEVEPHSLPSAAIKPMSSTSSLDLLLAISSTNTAPTCRALARVLKHIKKAEDGLSEYDSYIVYVADGPKRTWDWKVMAALKSQIEEMNAKRKGDIHLILLDLEEPPDDHHKKMNAETVTAINHCRSLCRVSQGSAYIPASIEEEDKHDEHGDNHHALEESFATIRSCLSNGSRSGGNASCSNALLSGITMEKF